MNLSIFTPAITENLFDVLDRGFSVNRKDIFSPLSSSLSFIPNADIRETENRYLMDIDLPGYTDKDININLHGKTLTVSSCREEKKEKNEADGSYIIRERISKEFSRRFTLPNDIDGDNISADFENGVLQVTIPRKAETKPKQIPIKAK